VEKYARGDRRVEGLSEGADDGLEGSRIAFACSCVIDGGTAYILSCWYRRWNCLIRIRELSIDVTFRALEATLKLSR
jgi:hypothetical protein